VTVVVLGAAGMLGHVVTTVLEEDGREVVAISRDGSFGRNSIAIDLENWSITQAVLQEVNPMWVINCAGALNDAVDTRRASAVFVNSYLPNALERLASDTGFRLITIGSDCVFEGDRGGYTVSDLPDALSSYGKSKHLGEVVSENSLTIRTSIVGPEIRSNGRGLLLWFQSQEKHAEGWTGARWTGVTTLELSRVLSGLVNGCIEVSGLWHFAPQRVISKFELLGLFNLTFRNPPIEIRQVQGVAHDRSLINNLPDLWEIPDYEAMLQALREWMIEHQELYVGTPFQMSTA